MRLTWAFLLTLLAWPAAAQTPPITGADPRQYVNAATGAPCTWNATSDVAPCLNAAITAVNTAGGGRILMPAGAFKINSSLVLKSGVKVIGQGGGDYAVCGNKLTWGGAAGGVMVSAEATNFPLVDMELSGLCLDGAAVAGTGFKLRSVNWSTFSNIYLTKVTGTGWDIDIAPASNSATAFVHFIRTYTDLTDASSITAKGWVIGPGTTAHDTNRNAWDDVTVIFQNGNGFVCGAADSNQVSNAHIEPLTAANTGISLELLGHPTSALQICRSNRFSGEFGAHLVARPVARGGAFPSASNTLFGNTESGGSFPLVETGAQLSYTLSSGGYTLSLPTSAGGGGLAVCVDSAGTLYKKATCP